MANTTMGEHLCSKAANKKSKHKISKLEAKIEHERKMRELAEKEMIKLKNKLKEIK